MRSSGVKRLTAAFPTLPTSSYVFALGGCTTAGFSALASLDYGRPLLPFALPSASIIRSSLNRNKGAVIEGDGKDWGSQEHSFPRPDNEDALYLTGRVKLIGDQAQRESLAGQFVAERAHVRSCSSIRARNVRDSRRQEPR